MEFKVEPAGDVAVIVIPAETLEMKNIQDFKDNIVSHLEGHKKIVFDLGRLNFIDSSGCGSLSFCMRTMKEKEDGSNIYLCCANNQVSATFRLIRLNRVFDIFETRDDAINAFTN